MKIFRIIQCAFCWEGRKEKRNWKGSRRSDHDIVVFKLGFLLGMRWDAGRQLIRPKKPTIPLIVVLSCIHLHTIVYLHITVRSCIQMNNRMYASSKMCKGPDATLDSAQVWFPSFCEKKTSTYIEALYFKAIYGKREMFGNIFQLYSTSW